ncbi:hypothetical protein NKI54_13990 [Mesorhizobium sp. M0663]|uniref:hypothetical protein n=1 Tax=Mesorhizobium sp. M0663 TaxID=2956981 RepID=UPI00333B077F
MSKVTYSGSEIALPHAKMVELRRQGKLNLGMNHEVAVKLASMGIKPKGTATLAFSFYKLLALGALAMGLYWAFTSAWWWGVLGLIAMTIIWNGNKAGHADNLLDAAMDDALFYERVRELNGWRYQIDSDAAAPFMATS